MQNLHDTGGDADKLPVSHLRECWQVRLVLIQIESSPPPNQELWDNNSDGLLHTCQFESLTVLKGTMSWDEHFIEAHKIILVLFVWPPVWLSPDSRVSDPDPHGSPFIWVVGSGSGSRRAKITHQIEKNPEFMFLSTGCSLLTAEGFSWSLGVLSGGLGISKLQFLQSRK